MMSQVMRCPLPIAVMTRVARDLVVCAVRFRR